MRTRSPLLVWPLDGIKLFITFVVLVVIVAGFQAQRKPSEPLESTPTAAVSPTRVAVVNPTQPATATGIAPAPTKPATATSVPPTQVKPTGAPMLSPLATVTPTTKPVTKPVSTTVLTVAPTVKATLAPTQAPTVAPTAKPTLAPTKAPSVTPTVQSTAVPGVLAITSPKPGESVGKRPIFVGLGRPGDTVIVLDGERDLGTAIVNVSGKWRLIAAEDLVAGEHTIRAIMKDSQGKVQGEEAIKITIKP